MIITILISAMLLAWLLFALRYLTRKDAHGNRIHACGGDCSRCSGCQISQKAEKSWKKQG